MVEQGKCRGIGINRYAPMISQLMFVDDLLFFGKINLQEVENLKTTLETYEKWSSQKVNYEKSALHFSRNVTESRKTEILRFMGVQVMGKVDKYLDKFLLQKD